MAHPATNLAANEKKSFTNGYLFGAPVKDLGWFASLIMSIASGMAAFFFATFLAIFTTLFYNAAGHHADYTHTYRYYGLPVGILVFLIAISYLGTFWTRRIFRKN